MKKNSPQRRLKWIHSIPESVWSAYMTDNHITSAALLTYQVMLSLDFKHDGEIYYSIERIAAECKSSDRQIKTHLKNLESRDWIQRERRGPKSCRIILKKT